MWTALKTNPKCYCSISQKEIGPTIGHDSNQIWNISENLTLENNPWLNTKMILKWGLINYYQLEILKISLHLWCFGISREMTEILLKQLSKGRIS